MKIEKRQKLIRRALNLILRGESLAELRVKKADGSFRVGLFDDLDKMTMAAANLSGKVAGIYVSLNGLRSATGEATNSVGPATRAAKDSDIKRRCWLPVDFDPVREPNTPSTETEHENALARAKECQAWLTAIGWPELVVADSGNGGHLLGRIDLPNNQPSSDLVRNCLEALALKFSDSQVRVDTANFNASRIWRLYGTLNCKGEKTEDRPYRRATLLEVPDELETVEPNILRNLASAVTFTGEERLGNGIDVDRWIRENNVPVAQEAPWKDTGRKWILPECPWNESHRNTAFIVQFPDRGVAAGCLHDSCSQKRWPDMRAYYEQQSALPVNETAPASLQASAVDKKSRANLLLELGLGAELFHTSEGEPYAKVKLTERRQTLPVNSAEFKQWLRQEYFFKTGEAPRPQVFQDAIAQLDASARYSGPKREVAIRVASANGLNYLDLADDDGRVVEFSAEGWKIVTDPNVHFLRPKGLWPLPVPVRGGTIAELEKFLNVRSDDDALLFECVLLVALRSRGPYPILAIYGEAGSAKTTMSRLFRRLIDPNKSDARGTPKDTRDLAIAANNGRVLVFDNLSFLPTWLSDALCRISTGGGLSTRALYTDSGEVLFEFERSIVLNGIEELATRTDLLDRCVVLELPFLNNYLEEQKFWRDFDDARPRILGVLLDVAVKTLRNLPSVRLAEKPRMADFALLGTAAESALGRPPGAFMNAYTRNRNNANTVALEASCITEPIRMLVDKSKWQGTASQLLKKLSALDSELAARNGWPKSPAKLSGMLKKLATALRRIGISVDFLRANDRIRTKLISIERRALSNESQDSTSKLAPTMKMSVAKATR